MEFKIFKNCRTDECQITAILNSQTFIKHSIAEIVNRLKEEVAKELAPEIKLRVMEEIKNTPNMAELIAKEAVRKLFKE